MSVISDNISLHSLSLPQSVRSETKDKFNAILNAALTKKNTCSKEKLLDDIDSTSASSRNFLDNEEDLYKRDNEKKEEKDSKEFILNKFLNDSSSLGASNTSNKTVVTLVKLPVPKPRKKKFTEDRRESIISNGTFDVTSPKILLSPSKDRDNRKGSISSTQTFNIASPKVITKYFNTNINNDIAVQIIGDLVLHESPTTSKIAVLATNSEVLEKADNETLIDRDSLESNSSKNTFIFDKDDNEKGLRSNSTEDITHKNIIQNTFDSTESKQVKYEKPKAKKRLHKANNSKKCEESTRGKIDGTQLYDYKHITEIKIHRTDKLLLNSLVIHPVVKIHIVDLRTGGYFKKSDKNRPVVFYYESDNNNYILPVMSSYYNLQEKRSFYPMWEEAILLNEDFKYFVNEHVIIFFEVMDFLTANVGTIKKNKDYEKGWYKIAFAFLKLVGKNNTENVGKKLRLQLYYPPIIQSKKLEHNNCELWEWWRSKNVKKYPSTLYITITKVISPATVIETFRSKTPLQKEELDTSIIKEPSNEIIREEQIKQDADNLKLKWHKELNNDKKLPEECVFQIDSFEEGCFVFKFSNSGLYLACSNKINDDFQIIIYQVEHFEEIFRFKNHQAFVYSIAWSKDDQYLLSASSDNTVAIWNFKNKSFFQILPHPSFVYASAINLENIIATGCYDHILRIWNFNKENYKFELYQELEGHKGFVTSLCYSHKNNIFLYSADSCGKIIEWKKETNWNLNRNLDVVDLRETKINQIMLFPNDKKMLVHSRDSSLRILSIANVCVIHWLHGALNTRVQTFCDISSIWPSYVASGSENGLVIVWDANTGKDVKTYEGFASKSKTAHCVQFHPKLNMLAMSHYGSNEPILIYCTKKNKEYAHQHEEVSFKVKKENESDISTQQEKVDFKKVLQKMDQLFI